MLQKLGDHIKACLSRAEACKLAADKATDPEVRKQSEQRHAPIICGEI
jgi:hypothetical protein